jgi:hypothetical protein
LGRLIVQQLDHGLPDLGQFFGEQASGLSPSGVTRNVDVARRMSQSA